MDPGWIWQRTQFPCNLFSEYLFEIFFYGSKTLFQQLIIFPLLFFVFDISSFLLDPQLQMLDDISA
jgi:hypothetical protein